MKLKIKFASHLLNLKLEFDLMKKLDFLKILIAI